MPLQQGELRVLRLSQKRIASRLRHATFPQSSDSKDENINLCFMLEMFINVSQENISSPVRQS